MFYFVFRYIPKSGIVDHMVFLSLVFGKTSILFSTVAVPTYILTNRVGRFPFLHILSNICYLQTGMKWYFIISLICIPLIIFSNIEHPLMCLLVICMSSLEKCLFGSSAHILDSVVCFCCCWAVWTIYIVWKLSPC